MASTEHLEAEVERLRAQVADLTGEAERQEEQTLRELLRAVRQAEDSLPSTSGWREWLFSVGFHISSKVPGEHSTVEEFAAAAR